jgi:glutathione S-transferase
MSELKIWGRLSSVNVQKVVWCARELKLDFERIEAGGAFGVVDTPEYRALNPNGKIPVLEDGALVLPESNAIVRYLSARYGNGNLWDADPARRAHSDRWMEWQSTELTPAMVTAFRELVRTAPALRDLAAIERSNRQTEPLMEILDHHLDAHRYVTGDTFTMGDISVGCAVHRWLGLPQPHQARPNVARYYQDLMRRPACAAVLTLPLA